MKSQDSWGRGNASLERLAAGETVHPGRGRLEVVDGVIWLTRRGDPRDHLLARGEAIEIGARDDVLFESWGPAQALIGWQPLDRLGRLQRAIAHLGTAVLRDAAARCNAVAARLGRAADRLARLACTKTQGTTGCSA